VERAVEADGVFAIGVMAGELEGRFDRLGAAVGE
jgi:hypothetical protein